jgi:hypothetical protein
MKLAATTAGFLCLAYGTACSSGLAQCHVGTDCASGVCFADGTCEPLPSSDAGGSDSGSIPPDAGTPPDAGMVGGPDSGPTSVDGGLCVPAYDGTIPRARIPLLAGLNASFEIAEDAGFSTAGTTLSDGGRAWDLSVSFPGDHVVDVQTESPSNYWFANSFPAATYVVQLSDTSDLLGIFQATDTALLLIGIASPTSAAPQTNVSYSPPVTVLSFPLQQGATWQTQSTVSGWYQGIYYPFYTESYVSSVDATGTLLSPYGTFPQVLRVQTTLTRTVGLLVTTIQSFDFAADCFGVVASITSQNDEPNVEFTNAAELRRLAP